MFQTLLGHSEQTYDSYEPREMLRRAVHWVSRRKVPSLSKDDEKLGEAKNVPKPTFSGSKGNHWGTDAVGFDWKEEDSRDDRWKEADIGRFLACSLPLGSAAGTVAKGLSIRLGNQQEDTVCYDTAHMKLRAAWTGGFLKFTPAPIRADLAAADGRRAGFRRRRVAGLGGEGDQVSRDAIGW